MNTNLLALRTYPLVIQVVKAAGAALPPAGAAANGERAVGADAEAACVDGAGLGRTVELELAVCYDGAGAGVAVAEDAVGKGADEGRVSSLLLVERLA